MGAEHGPGQLKAALRAEREVAGHVAAALRDALGGVAVGEQAYGRATTLLAAAHRIFDGLPRFLAPGYRAAYAAWVATVRSETGESNFTTAWAAGQALTSADVVALALRQLQPYGAFLP